MESNTNEPEVKVVFRKWQGSVIALFPEIPSDIQGYYCESYEHIGQHGSADYTGIVNRSRLATPTEYVDLQEELEQIGYNLRAMRRAGNNALEMRREYLRAMGY